MTRLSFAVGADISIDIYSRTLYQEYAIHISRNSSEVINGVVSKTATVVGGILKPALTLISSIILLLFIMGLLLSIDANIAIIAFVGFGSLYGGVVLFTRKKLNKNSQVVGYESTQVVKALQEGLGGIRDVLIGNSQKFYCNLYRNADLRLRKSLGSNTFIAGSPKYVMESVGMVLIAILAYAITSQQGGIETTIPVLGSLALGAQKMLPVLQQAYSSYSRIKGSKASFQDVLKFLEQPLPKYALAVAGSGSCFNSSPSSNTTPCALFNNRILLKNISFRYAKETPWILKDINLEIIKGERVGFIGATGSGKSTILDIIMGLLSPSSGNFVVDSENVTIKNKTSWQTCIAHVPQHVYLSDSTITENIAFGIAKEEINQKQVEEAAKQAKISEVIKGLSSKYQTIVGEGGVSLSGGQRQRIGIARALYKKANVLIFDEATSALDNDTEFAVMDAIEGLEKDLTIIFVAHRLTTLKSCDRIIKLENGVIDYIGTYQEILDLQKNQ